MSHLNELRAMSRCLLVVVPPAGGYCEVVCFPLRPEVETHRSLSTSLECAVKNMLPHVCLRSKK